MNRCDFMAKKKVKIRVTKKKINIKKILIVLLILSLITFGIIYFVHRPLKNIYISGNTILSDKEIIELSELSDYPPYINTYFMNIQSNLRKNNYIKKYFLQKIKLILKVMLYFLKK